MRATCKYCAILNLNTYRTKKLLYIRHLDTTTYKYMKFQTCFDVPVYNPGQKVLGTVLQYSYFSVISRFFLKTVHLFRSCLALLPSPTLYKVETRKEFWIHAFNIICGVRGGVRPV